MILNLVTDYCRSLARVFMSILGWILIFPITLVIPRTKKLIVVIGQGQGIFVDNTKYFLLQSNNGALPASVRTIFISERMDMVENVRSHGYETALYPTIKACYILLRAGVLITDNNEWAWHWRRFFLFGSKIIQLWHGVGFKRIQLDKLNNEAPEIKWRSKKLFKNLRLIILILRGQRVRYDLVNTTSKFYLNNVFRPAFSSNHFTTFGYPRNAFSELTDFPNNAIYENVDKNLLNLALNWMTCGHRVVIVAPTYRRSRPTPLGLDKSTCKWVDEYCDKNHIELIFKFHPAERKLAHISGKHLHICGCSTDIYPILPITHAMIVDFSSIYFDYLLLDKPILFLVSDMNEYLHRDRQLQFDYNKMTPGPKCTTWSELMVMLTTQLTNDDYADFRARLRKLAFDAIPQANSTESIIEFMKSKNWIPES